MAYIDPEKSFEPVKSATVEAVKGMFPVEGKTNVLEVENVFAKDDKSPNDISGQLTARHQSSTWGIPIYGTLVLKNKETGEVLDRKTRQLAVLPKMTSRYSYVVGGSEYQVGSMFRLKPGIYHRVTDNGLIEAQVNSSAKHRLAVRFDPASRQFVLDVDQSSALPLYPILKATGVSDESIRKSLGNSIAESNSTTKVRNQNVVPLDVNAEIFKAHKRLTGKDASTLEEAQQGIKAVFESHKMDSDVNRITTGLTGKAHLDGDLLLGSAKKLLKISTKEEDTDDRDALYFKSIHGTEDFLSEKLANYKKKDFSRKIKNNIDRKSDISSVFSHELLSGPIRQFFTSTSISQRTNQTNPLSMLSEHHKTTILGADAGGISSLHQIKNAPRIIGPTHLAFLDPVQTPESQTIGVTLNLALAANKKGNKLYTTAYNIKTGKLEDLDPEQALKTVTVFPDEVKWDKDGKPTPLNEYVRAADGKGDVVKVKFNTATHIFPSAKALFSVSANLVPFLGNNQGNRAMTASRQQEQAVSLKHREEPLVQSKTEGPRTFEEVVGSFAAHKSPVSGVVTEVTDNHIKVKAGDEEHKIQIYNRFPLNDGYSMLHATPTVKVGDKVDKGSLLADTNYTKNGRLALGTNLRVGYIPFKGYNYEDGVVISESASQKLTSLHLRQDEFNVNDNTVVDPMLFLRLYGQDVDRNSWSKIGADGIIKKGQKILPGDIWATALQRREIKPGTSGEALYRAVSKKSRTPYENKSMVWEGAPGRVAEVIKDKGKVKIFVETEEPMIVGDKLVGRHGNKGIVTMIVPDKDMPKDAKGDAVEVLLNPAGIPGRINLGQTLETAASKLALKNGKAYVTENFPAQKDGDTLGKLQKDLDKENISDTEELFDPKTGKSLGPIQVGHQYILKLTHQVDKKMTARAGGAGYSYDLDQSPTGGSHGGGQSLGNLGNYVLLAHGARNNLREMFSQKSSLPESSGIGKVDYWAALKNNHPIPPPEVPFAFKKLEAHIKGMGIDIRKEGSKYQLAPLTDSQIKKMSAGELKDPALDYARKDLSPKRGGIFDPYVTGGLEGKAWSHINLGESIPNPVFARPIASLLNINLSDVDKVVAGEKAVNGKSGTNAIRDALRDIDVDEEIKTVRAQLQKTTSDSKIAELNKKHRYLMALKNTGLKPDEAYTLSMVPVLPPYMRPITRMPDEKIRSADANDLYRNIGIHVQQFKEIKKKPDLAAISADEKRAQVYNSVKALFLVGMPPEGKDKKGRTSLAGIISGKNYEGGGSPKSGYFQDAVLARRQDMSMRSTINPEPEMGIDEVKLPEKAARELFRPLVSRELVRNRSAKHSLEASDLIDRNSPAARSALQTVLDRTPVLLKRDPALHKFSIMAFKPSLTDGKAIRIHPLVTGGFNADFDGDSIDLDTPLALRIHGQIDCLTGRELIPLLGIQDGNYVAQVRGVEAWTYTGWAPVKTVSFHEVVGKKKYRVLLKNGTSVIVSEDHSLMSGQQKVLPTSLVPGKTLDSGFPTPQESGSGTYGLGVIYGNFFGDGCAELREQGGGRIAIACLPKVDRDYLMGLWVEEFPGCTPSPYKWGFHVNGVDRAADFLRTCGRYCAGKFIDSELLSKGPEFLKGMLAGYIQSDGSVERTRSGSYLVRTWSRSKKLRDGMAFVAGMLGLPFSTRERVVKKETNYIISFGKEAIKKLDYRCPGEKYERLAEARREYSTNRKDSRKSQSLRGFEVVSIEEVPYTDRMIDLEVSDSSHVFGLASGLIVHNTMSVFVPVSDEAREEAYGMLPSRNLFSPTTGDVMYRPSQEAQIGLWKLTDWKDKGLVKSSAPANKQEVFDFNNPAAALKAMRQGKIDPDDTSKTVRVDGKDTTVGRLMIASVLPKESSFVPKVLYDPDFRLDSKRTKALLEDTAQKFPGAYPDTSNALKDLGNEMAYRGKSSFKLGDFSAVKSLRDPIFAAAEKEIRKVQESKLDTGAKKQQIAVIASDARQKVNKAILAHFEKTRGENGIYEYVRSGARGNMTQFGQIVAGPIQVENGLSQPVPVLITKSYSEGLPSGEYWAALHGARKGTIQKVKGVAEPGYLSKIVVNSALDYLVTSEDCGTTNGISAAVTDQQATIDRYAAEDVSVGGKTLLNRNQLITPQVLSELKAAGVSTLKVRSPITCAEPKGVCQKCHGLFEDGKPPKIGLSVGVIAAQAVSEPATQLSLKSFHMGGVVGARVLNTDSFTQIQQMLKLPQIIPNSATLATEEGEIERVSKDPAGGWDVRVKGVRHYVPGHLDPLVQKGQKVTPGQPLSEGSINPRQLLPLQGLGAVQNHLTNEIAGMYAAQVAPLKRRNVEMLVRIMTNNAEVVDPGDSDSYVRGDIVSAAQIDAINKGLQNPIKYKPILMGVNELPDHQEDWMGGLNFEGLTDVLKDGAGFGRVSDIHGTHPIPALAHASEFGVAPKGKPYAF